jgi:hypothetical protein
VSLPAGTSRAVKTIAYKLKIPERSAGSPRGGCDAWRGTRCPIVRKTAIAGTPKALQAEVALVGSFMVASFDAVLHGV